MEKSPLPFAELNVRLRFNTLIGMYSFDIEPNQYHRQSRFMDNFDATHMKYDRSLRAVFPLLMAKNLTSEFNYGTSIYLEVNDTIYY